MYIDIITVADVPDDHDTRLVAMNIEGLTRLRLKVFERPDLVLAKLCRNIDRDRENVVALVRGSGLDIDVLMVPDACGLARTTRTLCRTQRKKLHEYPGEAMGYRVLEVWAALRIGAAILPKSKVTGSHAYPIKNNAGRA